MIEDENARNMAIAARPIKKVMEAKARKKIKAVRAQQKLAAKMDGVANDTDISDKAKMRALQKLYDKGVSIKRPRAVTVVASKSKGKAAGKKNVKVVDKRMKKDKDARIRTGNRNFKGGKKGKKSKVTAKVAAQAPRTKIRKRKGQ
jgi:AdoMet-dependent rRNA methyltransferase SPB1